MEFGDVEFCVCGIGILRLWNFALWDLALWNFACVEFCVWNLACGILYLWDLVPTEDQTKGSPDYKPRLVAALVFEIVRCSYRLFQAFL